MKNVEIKQEVREFYNQVGWKQISAGVYQNAQYEDLRPVSRDYIHKCHLRVNRHLKTSGRFLLDAGSGPVQYPEYLTYSENYKYRVCLDISILAVKEARERLDTRGLYVVADVAALPFKCEVFDGVVSLHTLHHLPGEDQKRAYFELDRVLNPGCTAVVVNGWTSSLLMKRFYLPMVAFERLGGIFSRLFGRSATTKKPTELGGTPTKQNQVPAAKKPAGTYVQKIDANWIRKELKSLDSVKILVWRSVSVRFLRARIKPWLGGRLWLKLLYRLEERHPQWFGENGQYPLIVIHKYDVSVG
ncbi:MAG: class I SAM-dependent methyltransferase [Anaerolineaceae bacterium]|nr:class I SAM-dependent methyltransferase [Anaerolineaceae bacterium]